MISSCSNFSQHMRIEMFVAKAATTAFGRHLWYLSEILIGFAFFDDDVTVEEKRKMVIALKEKDGLEEPPKRIAPLLEHMAKYLSDFVTKATRRFFNLLNLSDEILDIDPACWMNNDVYRASQAVVDSVKVVNDLAERGVALIQEFNSSITRNEEQKQFLLQVIEDHRKSFSFPTKAGAIKRARPQ